MQPQTLLGLGFAPITNVTTESAYHLSLLEANEVQWYTVRRTKKRKQSQRLVQVQQMRLSGNCNDFVLVQ